MGAHFRLSHPWVAYTYPKFMRVPLPTGARTICIWPRIIEGKNCHISLCNYLTDLVCVPMDLLPWPPDPLGFLAGLGLWEGGTGARGVEVCLGDWPDDEAVLEGLDWYWKRKKNRGFFINRSRTIAQSLERLNAERQMESLIPGAAPLLWVLQLLRN